MELKEIQLLYEAGQLAEAVAEPRGDGWAVLFHRQDGGGEILTDHAGKERHFHTLEAVTHLIQEVGFKDLRIEERF